MRSTFTLNVLSDEECIKRFKQTKEEAVFNCLLNRYAKSMRRIIYSIIQGTEEDVEDIMQETALALYKNLSEFSFKSSFITYLYRLCRNKAVDHIRKKKKDIKLKNRVINAFPAGNNDTPEKAAERKETRSTLVKTLRELTEAERTIIVLKDIEHLSLEEISGILKKPLGTVKSRLHRARIHAAEIFRENEEGKR